MQGRKSVLPDLYDQKKLSDIEIIMNSKRFFPNRSILGSFSGYFQHIFEEHPGSSQICFITNKDHLYKSGDSIDSQHKVELVVAFDEFQLTQVLKYLYLQIPFLSEDLISTFQAKTPSNALLSPLYNNPTWKDVILLVENEKLYAHKAILASRSEYFYTIFISPFKESQQLEINIQNVDLSAFKKLIQYLYHTMTLESVEESANILELADRFGIPSLVEECYLFLEKNLEFETCCELLEFSNLYTCPTVDFRLSCLTFIMQNFQQVCETDGFLMLDVSNLCEILDSDDLVVSKEQVAFEAVLKWVRYEKKNRIPHISTLLSKIR